MDEYVSNPTLENLRTALMEHVASNERRFMAFQTSLQNAMGKMAPAKGMIMADGQSDTVKINNTMPGSDPMAAMAMAMSGGRGQADGLFGAGGGGLLGGLLLGTLLRGGGLLGGQGSGEMTAVTQPQANMSIMAALGDLKQAVAVGTAQMETSQALQSSTIQAQLSQVAAATVAQVSGVKDTVNSNTVALMQMINGVTAAISTDGEKTRALVTQQYEATLNRQLSDANAAIIELRSQLNGGVAARSAEINVTQTVNQMQQQQQQQVLMERINSIVAEHQNIRQGIINLGTMSGSAGQQTAANTRVN